MTTLILPTTLFIINFTIAMTFPTPIRAYCSSSKSQQLCAVLHNLRLPIVLLLMVFSCALAATRVAFALEVTTGFSSELDGQIPKRTGETEFTCSDTVYLLMDVGGLEAGVHGVEVHWMGPRGNRQELTRFDATSTGDPLIVWAWMRLHPPEDTGLVRAFDPSLGMRNFIGEWDIRIFIDTKQVARDSFNVLC